MLFNQNLLAVDDVKAFLQFAHALTCKIEDTLIRHCGLDSIDTLDAHGSEVCQRIAALETLLK